MYQGLVMRRRRRHPRLGALPPPRPAPPPYARTRTSRSRPARCSTSPSRSATTPRATRTRSRASQSRRGTLGGTLDAGTYTPDNGFHGRDEFTYRVTDSGNEVSQPATVRILVDTAPTCADGSVSTQVNQTVRIPLPCKDADEDGLFIEWNNGDHGIVAFDKTAGAFVYTPDSGYVGPDSFVYAVRDDFGLTSRPGRMTTIDVKPAPVPTWRRHPAAEGPDRAGRQPQDLAKPLRQALSKGLSIVLSANENGTAQLTLTVDKATARRLKLDRKAKKPVTVGGLKAALTPESATLEDQAVVEGASAP